MSICAPVAVFTYNKINETICVMKALANNLLAKETDVYVFSNAAIPGKDDDKTISFLREELCKFKDCFLHYEIISRDRNDGVNCNMIDGINYVLSKHERIIVVEDDILTCQVFLNYMNMALDYYKDNDDIFTICSYNPAEDNQKYDNDTFSWKIFKCWGWGTWKDRWNEFNINENVLDKLDYCVARHHDVQLSDVLQNDVLFKEGHHDNVLDYKILCWQLAAHKLSIYPRKSLCDNIGLNGSGISKINNRDYNNSNFNIDYKISRFSFSDKELTYQGNSNLFKEFRKKNCLYNFYEKENQKEYMYRDLYYSATKAACYNNCFDKFFEEKGISYVSIYGFGLAGKLLYSMIKDYVEISYIIDKNYQNDDALILSDNDDFPACDLMIVTPIWDYYKIEESVKDGGYAFPVMNMFDLMIELWLHGKMRWIGSK